MQLPQLPLIHGAGGAGHEAAGLGGLGKGDDFADVVHARQQHHEPVQAQGQAAMGRGAVAEGIEQEAELGARFGLADAQGPEHAALGFGVMDADAAAAHLVAVEHQVVGHGPAGARVRIQQGHVLGMRAGKGMVAGHEALIFLAPLQQGEVHHPQKRKCVFVMEKSGKSRVLLQGG